MTQRRWKRPTLAGVVKKVLKMIWLILGINVV